MKNVITGTACLILLFAVFLQFIHIQTMVCDLRLVMAAAENFRETARLEGCVSEKNEKSLKREIAVETGIHADEIKVRGTRRPVKRGGKVHYSLSVPLGRFVLARRFFDMKEDDCICYREERWTASEYQAGSERAGHQGVRNE